MDRVQVPPELEAEVEGAFFNVSETDEDGQSRRLLPVGIKVLMVIAGLVFLAGAGFLLQETVGVNQESLVDVSDSELSETDPNQEIVQLREQLAAAPTEQELVRFRKDHMLEIEELNHGWAGKLEDIQSQHDTELADLIEQHRADLQAERAKTTAAQRLQAQAEGDLAVELGFLPAAVSSVVNSPERLLVAEHFIGVEWLIERQWLGGLNDEDHIFLGDAVSLYSAGEAPGVAEWDEDGSLLRVPATMPQLVLSEFVLEESHLDPNYGLLADIGHILGDETDTGPLFEEAKELLEAKACKDVQSLRKFVNDTYKAALAAARGHEVLLRWQDAEGLYHDHQDVTDQMLLASVCAG